jgi:hypothetical protein
MLPKILSRSSLLVFLFAAASCHTKSDDIIPAFNNFKFDAQVIEKLPLYDSLASAIEGKIHSFHTHIDDNASYHAFRYMPDSKDAEVFKTLPPDIGINVDQYFTKISKDLIIAFDVFKDSSIKIYIRRSRLEKTEVDITENLSYNPVANKLRRRDYPIKDTILNPHWLYWVRFDKDGLF